MNKFTAFILVMILFFVGCSTPLSNNPSTPNFTKIPSIPTNALPLAFTSTLMSTIEPTQTSTATSTPDYNKIGRLNQLAVTKLDSCYVKYPLPIVSEFKNIQETDTTSSVPRDYCKVDCVSREWSAPDGSAIKFVVIRASSPLEASTFLGQEYEKYMQAHSSEVVGFENPYDGEHDDTWAGKTYPGTTALYATVHESFFMLMEWTITPQGFDLEFDFAMTKELADLQFRKINAAIGTPFVSLTEQAGCITP